MKMLKLNLINNITLAITLLGSLNLYAEPLNLSFLQGITELDPRTVENLGKKYIPGKYLINVELNGNKLGNHMITIDEADSDVICLSSEWLSEVGINIEEVFFKNNYDLERKCYRLEDGSGTKVSFDFSNQLMKFSIPQDGLVKEKLEELPWDYGIDALRLRYNANINKTDSGTYSYSSVSATANLSEWLFSSSLYASESDLDVSMFTATHALEAAKADLSIGQSYMSNSSIGNSGFIGASLVSNSSMTPGDIGYKPVFRGVALSNARVTLVQNTNVIYSELLPPGPFTIDNVSLLNSGDVTMTITESDGSVNEQTFPITFSGNSLNQGEVEYGIYSGLRDDSKSKLDGVFIGGFIGYGFDDYTINLSSVLHRKYQGFGGRIIKDLGVFGNLNFEQAFSYAKSNNDSFNGSKFEVGYNKIFNKNTHFQLSTTQYLSQEYVDFSEFDIKEDMIDNSVKIERQYSVDISHKLTPNISLTLGSWYRSYWKGIGDNITFSGGISKKFDWFTANISASYNKRGGESDYSGSLSVSVPLDLYGKTYNSFASANFSQSGRSYVLGSSSSVNEDLDYSASIGYEDGSNNKSYSLDSTYRNEYSSLRGYLSQTGGANSIGGSLSGEIIVLPTKDDVLFSKHIGHTVAVANVENIEGVKFNSSRSSTNHKGNAIITLSDYSENRIAVNADTLPLNIELSKAIKKAVPTSGAVLYVPFEAIKINRYLLQIRNVDGTFLKNGEWATTEDGQPLGFISQNGILFVNTINEISSLKFKDCTVSKSEIKNVLELQEVRCEPND
ncbi:fimbria/pilus outer membrane usher protein [Vibrio harveyi]|uniref:fimbria/pilus outer membrane usher protein n=1 Tax=Vibrio harveyi TaxID=669 RepID=UPI002380747D|nr:fimbria/pilus outer membrane usher protein [Vibrio harveyi]